MNQYYYIGPNNQQMGPMPGEELVGIINMDTMVWAPGMANWMPAKNVPELAEALAMKQQQQAPQPPFVGAAPNVPPYQGQHIPYGGPAQPQGQYGYAQQNQYQNNFNGGMPPRPENYLVWAILTIVCCCWPLGIVAVVYASKVNGLYDQGQYEEAKKASDNAKTWTIVSAVLGFVATGVAFFAGMLDGFISAF